MAAPAASMPSMRRWPVASGVVNGPAAWAARSIDCHETPGAGIMAGAFAVTSAVKAEAGRSTSACARAVSGPADRFSAAANAWRGPCTVASSARAPRSGRPAMRAMRPWAGSCSERPAAVSVGVRVAVRVYAAGPGPSGVMVAWAVRSSSAFTSARAAKARSAAVPATGAPISARGMLSSFTVMRTGSEKGWFGAGSALAGAPGSGRRGTCSRAMARRSISACRCSSDSGDQSSATSSAMA